MKGLPSIMDSFAILRHSVNAHRAIYFVYLTKLGQLRGNVKTDPR
jgi:hypothetical protein